MPTGRLGIVILGVAAVLTGVDGAVAVPTGFFLGIGGSGENWTGTRGSSLCSGTGGGGRSASDFGVGRAFDIEFDSGGAVTGGDIWGGNVVVVGPGEVSIGGTAGRALENRDLPPVLGTASEAILAEGRQEASLGAASPAAGASNVSRCWS